MTTVEHRDLEFLEAHVWEHCVAPSIEFNPVMQRGMVISKLGQLAAVETANQFISHDEQEELDRRYIGAYRMSDQESLQDRDELLSWIGADDSYMKDDPLQTEVKSLDNRIFLSGAPVILIEKRNVQSYTKAGMCVVSSVASLIPTSIGVAADSPDLFIFDDRHKVSEIIAFIKVDQEEAARY